jgi:hypothetical protein
MRWETRIVMERKHLVQLYLFWTFFCHDGRLSIVPLLPNAAFLFSSFPQPNLKRLRCLHTYIALPDSHP